MDGWITLSEMEKKYNIKAATIRRYIHENKMPEGILEKIGKTWIIKEDYVKSKYTKREKDDIIE